MRCVSPISLVLCPAESESCEDDLPQIRRNAALLQTDFEVTYGLRFNGTTSSESCGVK